MPSGKRIRTTGAFAVSALLIALAAPAGAAAAPTLGDAWSSQVQNSSARLQAKVNPGGLPTSAYFEYATKAAFEANGFTGAKKTTTNAGSGNTLLTLNFPILTGLSADTEYRYRLTAANSSGSSVGQVQFFITRPTGGGALLADGRGWEMVSPVDKNGGQVEPPGAIAKGGVLQAAGGGEAVTYGSAASFGVGEGAPPASQYLASRTSGGWATRNITAPIFSGTYDLSEGGVPYQLFSADLSRALLLNGEHCRGGATGCAVTNPPISGSGAPTGYQNYYLWEGASGSFAALLTSADVAGLSFSPAAFDLRFAGASSDLGHVVLSSCAKLTANATEVPSGPGCEEAKQNLYKWSVGGALTLVNLLPGDTTGTPGASLAARSAAISEDGSRVYFSYEGSLYLREGSATKLVANAAQLQSASPNGTTAFYTSGAHLYRYQSAGAGTSVDLTPSGGVTGVLGASLAGDAVYYQDAGALKRWHNGVTSTVAPGAEAALASDFPPATGTARVSADGTKLLFVSAARLTGFDNTDLITGKPDAEIYLYDAAAPSLTCVSCNPTNQRPVGTATIPGAVANGTAPGSTQVYKPRVLSANGRRVFFDSADSLVLTDTNKDHLSGTGINDVYQWEAQGEGSCTKPGGCITLISSGRSEGGASFVDASLEGADAFFITDDSLVAADPGSLDLYDARIGGGFAVPPPPIPCQGDACQVLPPEPVDPTLTTVLVGRGNPPVRYHRLNRRKHQQKNHKKHRAQRGGKKR